MSDQKILSSNNAARAATILLSVLSVAAAFGLRFAPVLVLLLGALVIAPLMAAVLSQTTRAKQWLIFIGLSMINLLLCPSVALAILSIALWYIGAMLFAIIHHYTVDLFSILLYGGFGVLLSVALGVAVLIKQQYGVWDIMRIYTSIEQVMLSSLDQLEAIYQKLLTGQELEHIMPIFQAMRQNITSFVYQIFSLAISFIAGLYLWAVKAGQWLSRRMPRPALIPPLIFYTVPREITLCYIVICAISLFISNEHYQYALSIANTLMNWLFVLAGIGLVDAFAQRKLSGSVRRIIKIALLIAAFISDNFAMGILSIVLSVLGMFVSLSRRIIITKGEGK